MTAVRYESVKAVTGHELAWIVDEKGQVWRESPSELIPSKHVTVDDLKLMVRDGLVKEILNGNPR